MIDQHLELREIDKLIRSAPMGVRLLTALVSQGDLSLQKEVNQSRQNLFVLGELQKLFHEQNRTVRWGYLQVIFKNEHVPSLETELLEYLWQLTSGYQIIQTEWSPILALYFAMRSADLKQNNEIFLEKVSRRDIELLQDCSAFLDIHKNWSEKSENIQNSLTEQVSSTELRNSIRVSIPPIVENNRRLSGLNVSPAASSISSAIENQNASILILDDHSLVRKGIMRDARGELVESGKLACVLSLSNKQSYVRPAFASANILIVAPRDEQIDCKNAPILFATNIEKDESPSLRLNELKGIKELLKNKPVKDFPLKFSITEPLEVFQNDTELLPGRYFKSKSQLTLEAFLRRYEKTTPLYDIVDVIRPRPIKKGENLNPESLNNPVSVIEILVSDLIHGDVLTVPKSEDRSFLLSSNEISKFKKQTIEPGDLLFSFKGTIGKISLAGAAFSNERHKYFASQGMLIIRPKVFSPIDPLILLNYLSHPCATTIFEERATGLGMKNLPIDALNQFVVPIPQRSELIELEQSITMGHEEIARVNEQIQQLQNRLLEVREKLWPNLELGSE